MTSVYILSETRTPQGSFLGGLSKIPATKLGGIAIRSSVEKSGLSNELIDEVFVGNVLSCDLGQNPAKQCSIQGGLPASTPCTLVNKVCCSSMKALILATQLIKSNEINTAVVAGTENMSLSPRILENTRSIKKMGDAHFEQPFDAKDDMIVDGLWDSFNDMHMGALADKLANKFQISRSEQDRYSIQSFQRAKTAWENGHVKVIQVENVNEDEVMKKLVVEKVPTLKPCFDTNGTITAASSSAISDGAAAIVLASESFISAHSDLNLQPLAKIISYADAGRDPSEFIYAPVDAAKAALTKAGLNVNDIDLWEVNEAFAAVPLLFMKELNINEEIVNVFGGGISIGHPLGCTGIRIISTLIQALKAKGKKRGLAALCNGGGGANAVIIELVQ